MNEWTTWKIKLCCVDVTATKYLLRLSEDYVQDINPWSAAFDLSSLPFDYASSILGFYFVKEAFSWRNYLAFLSCGMWTGHKNSEAILAWTELSLKEFIYKKGPKNQCFKIMHMNIVLRAVNMSAHILTILLSPSHFIQKCL